MIILWNRGVAKPVSAFLQSGRARAYVVIYEAPVGGGGGGPALAALAYYRKLLLGG